MADPENISPDPTPPQEGRPLLFGCLVLAIAALVLGGAFALGAWSAARGHEPPALKP